MKRSGFKRRTGAKLKAKSAVEKRRRALRRARLGKETVARSAVKAERVWKSQEYIDFVKSMPCFLRPVRLLEVGAPWTFHHVGGCEGITDPHHCRKLLPSGLLPRHDWLAIPLCRKHHKAMDGDERALWQRLGLDPRDFIRTFSPEGAQALAALERQT